MAMKRRTGLRIRDQGGPEEVKVALIKFARWLRTQYSFPMRVPVYLYRVGELTTRDGSKASASFFAPWARNVEPYIRIAAGHYRNEKADRGRDNALAAYICSLAHEVVHYQQWLATGVMSERNVAKKARTIMLRYAKTVDRP